MISFRGFLTEDKIQALFEALEGQKGEREKFLIGTYSNKWDYIKGEKDSRDTVDYSGFDKYKTIDDFITAVGKADPSKKGIYMQWLAKLMLKNPKDNKPEDLYKVKKDLKKFEELGPKLPVKDINAVKSFHDLSSLIEPLLNKPKTAAEKKAERDQDKFDKMKTGIIDVYKGGEGWIKIPTTKATACFLGQSTKWCTAASSSHNMFDHYNSSDSLFVVYDKATQSRSQLHIESGQFAGADDKNKGLHTVPEWARKHIIDWYKKNNPKLDVKHIMAFATKFGDKDIAKGTEHEEVLDLMKQYGVI